MPNLEHELRALLNKHSAENGSDTPDFILAQFLLGCLDAFDSATKSREEWYGRPDPWKRPALPGDTLTQQTGMRPMTPGQ